MGNKPPGSMPIRRFMKAPVKSPRSAPNGISKANRTGIILETENKALHQPHPEAHAPAEEEPAKSLIVPKDTFAIHKVSAEIHLGSASRKNWGGISAVSGENKF